jgi:hypothetical protein
MSKFEGKLNAHSLIYLLGHCESESHTVHKLTEQHLTADLLAPKESDFMHKQSGILRPAAKLHQGNMTGSQDIQNGWILSGQISYIPDRTPHTTSSITLAWKIKQYDDA